MWGVEVIGIAKSLKNYIAEEEYKRRKVEDRPKQGVDFLNMKDVTPQKKGKALIDEKPKNLNPHKHWLEATLPTGKTKDNAMS